MAGDSACVLVVEDEALVRMMAVDTLEEAGFTVLQAAHPEQALKVFADTEKLDAIVCDVGLPGVRGPELIAKAREKWPKLPALLMTGYLQQSVADQIGANMDVLSKPFAPEDLPRKVRALIAAARGADAKPYFRP